MQNLTNHVSKLEQEINDISLNINKVQNKSNGTMSSIVEKLKLLSKSSPNIINNVDTTSIESRNRKHFSYRDNYFDQNLYNHNDIHDYNIKQKNLYKINTPSLKIFHKSANCKKKHKNTLNFNDNEDNENSKENDFKYKLLKYSKDGNEDIKYKSKIQNNNCFNKSNIKLDNDVTSNEKRYSNRSYNKNYITTLKENHKILKAKSVYNNDYMKKKSIMNNDTKNNDISFYNDAIDQKNGNKDNNINIVKPKIIKYIKTEALNTNNNNNKNNNVNDMKITNKNINGNNKINSNAIEIDQIIKLMNVQNIDDAILKLKQLKKRNEFYFKIKNIYCQNDFTKKNKIIKPSENECEKILSWIKKINSENKEIECYENLCKNIMYDNNINNFSEFKIFLNEILGNMGKNEKFFENMKQICQNEFTPELINGKEIDNLENTSQNQSNSDI